MLYKDKVFAGSTNFSQHLTAGYLKLQNLTKLYRCPCILDIKMGFVGISEKNKARFEQTGSSTHGFRICGMSVPCLSAH